MKESTRKENEATYNSAFENEDFIICRKIDFHLGISALLHNAWKHRNSESHIYALLSYIQTIQSLTLLHKTIPTRVVAPWPQPLFGTLGAPEGAEHYPSGQNVLRLPGNFYPDHARILVFGGKEQGPSYSLQAPISIALDSSEAKTLNSEYSWETSDSKYAAGKIADSHVAQVCESSLAGLAHNPFWTSLYAFLIVGPYFSLFAWKTRPDAASLEVLPSVPPISKQGLAKDKEAQVAQRHEAIQQRIARIQQTPLPDVIYYNEPMFDFGVKPSLKWFEQATLSRNYLHALWLPTSTLSEELACQPSWFKTDGSIIGNAYLRGSSVKRNTGTAALRQKVINEAVKRELDDMDLTGDQPGDDHTLTGPKPPDSSDSQQSRFSEAEPQVVDLNAGPHPMRMRASAARAVKNAVTRTILG